MTYILLTFIVLLPAFFFAITLLPWPDIPPVVFNVVLDFFAAVWVMNRYIAIDTLFQFAYYIALIEISVVVIKYISSILFPNSQTTVTDHL